MGLPTTSVVMPTYNRAAALERVVRPLLADEGALEVIVVVDGCRDGSLELLEAIAAEEPRLRPVFIQNSGEMGAREAGAHAARGEVVMFVDDDVLASPGLVAGHGRRHAGAQRRLVLGYMPVKLPQRRTPEAFATWLYADEYERRCAIYEREPASVLRELWAGNFSIRRADCLEIGLRNPAYTERYHPDRDFGIRCLEAGIEGVFDRSLRATHLHDRSLEAFVRDARSQGAGRVLIGHLHPEIVGPLDHAEFERDLPAPLRAVLRAGRRRAPYRALGAALVGLVRAAGRLHLWSLQSSAAKLLRRLEQQRGAREAGRPF